MTRCLLHGLSSLSALLGAVLVVLMSFPSMPVAAVAGSYSVLYEVRLDPAERTAEVTIRLSHGADLVRRIELRTKPGRYRHFSGDGSIEEVQGGVRWRPPKEGGALRYSFLIDHQRKRGGYDSYITETWAMMRGDDVVPPARVRTRIGARAQARLRLELPPKWSAATPFPRDRDGDYRLEDPGRRFLRPTGWLAFGRLGVLRERIGDTRVTVAGPVRQGLRRHDLLALLHWTLPTLEGLTGHLPERLLVVGAADPMWRGGLSGPRSLYLHAARPLIANDGTSPLLHELMHTVMHARAGDGGDWIVEGLAQYYSLELLLRSGTISRPRYRKTLTGIERRGQAVGKLDVVAATGAVTAHAVAVLHQLDRRLRKETGGRAGLDDVLRAMIAAPQPWTTASFRAVCERFSVGSLEGFFRHWVPQDP